jgi:DNA-binding transcriptional LysR family regulator
MAPTDLTRHDCIIYTRLATGNRWHFAGRNGPVAVEVSGRFRADNSEAVREAVLGGAGIAARVPPMDYRHKPTHVGGSILDADWGSIFNAG